MVINAHLLAVIAIIALISLAFFAKKKLKDLTYGIGLGMESFLLWFGFIFSTVVCAFCIAALISVSFNIVREKEELVNPSVETTQYKVTQIKTNLETNEQTYVLTSDSDDSDVVKSYHSPSSC